MKRNKIVSILFSTDELKHIDKKIKELFIKSDKMITRSKFIRNIVLQCLEYKQENVSPVENDTDSEAESKDFFEDVEF